MLLHLRPLSHTSRHHSARPSYIAFRSIANEEKARIVRHLCLPAADRPTDFAVSETYLKLHAALLADDSVPSGEKG